jgi:3-oxoacyl-[acyl-carrier-protein] synthase I
VVCLDEFTGERAADGRIPAQEVVTELTRRAAKRLPQLDVASTTRGGAGMAFALDGALADLEKNKIDAVVVAGVHSDYDPARIQALSAARRLFTIDRLDALIPGEAAACAVILRGDHARSLRLPIHARIHTLATGHARARPDNDESAYEAGAMTAVTRSAGAELQQHGLRAGWFLTDLSFERWRLYELQSMMTRTQKLWCEPQYCDAPAQRLGYLGAAVMPLHLVLASEAWRRGFGPHPIAISLAGSDGGERAAILLSAPRA